MPLSEPYISQRYKRHRKRRYKKTKRFLQATNTDKKASEIHRATALLCNPQCKRRCFLQRILRSATTENIKPKNYHSLS